MCPGINSGSQNGSVWYCQVAGSFRLQGQSVQSSRASKSVCSIRILIVVRVGDRSVRRVGGRPEPRPVHPAPEGAHARGVTRVLGGHVDVLAPTCCRSRPSGSRPRSGPARARDVPSVVLVVQLRVLGDEGLVLDDQRDLLSRDEVPQRSAPARSSSVIR